MIWPFRKPNPARDLANMGHQQYRDRVHAKADELRRQMGPPAVKWKR